jgi:hypothetical protein
MGKTVITAILMMVLAAAGSEAQPLSAKWEELTSSDFVKALQASNNQARQPFAARSVSLSSAYTRRM